MRSASNLWHSGIVRRSSDLTPCEPLCSQVSSSFLLSFLLFFSSLSCSFQPVPFSVQSSNSSVLLFCKQFEYCSDNNKRVSPLQNTWTSCLLSIAWIPWNLSFLYISFMKKDSKRCCDTTTPESIHTKDESKRGSEFAFIFGVNWPIQWM